MNKEFIPYEQALALKELGFDEPCFGRYYYKESYPMLNPKSEETELVFEFGQYLKQTEVTILAPVYQQAFRFFREKYDLQYTIVWNKHYPDTPNKWNVRKNWKDELIIPYGYGGMCKTYEEAELDCLRKLIEIVKNK